MQNSRIEYQTFLTDAISSLLLLLLLTILFSSCGKSFSQKEQEQSVMALQSDTCNNPDANINCCFINIPKPISHIMTIADANEPGNRLIITGTIFKADDTTPFPDILLYAYHTDWKGYYSKSGNETGVQKWHGHLHGWCKTDSKGYYEIHTIRPARYPDNSMPAHIHAVVKTEDGQSYYISDYVFKDDSLVDDKYISSLSNAGGTGIVDITKSHDNIWTGQRDIVLKNKRDGK